MQWGSHHAREVGGDDPMARRCDRIDDEAVLAPHVAGTGKHDDQAPGPTGVVVGEHRVVVRDHHVLLHRLHGDVGQ